MKNWCWYCTVLSEPSYQMLRALVEGHVLSFLRQNAEFPCWNSETAFLCMYKCNYMVYLSLCSPFPHIVKICLFFCLWSVSLCLLAKQKAVEWQNPFRNTRGANNNGDDTKFINIFFNFKTNFFHSLSSHCLFVSLKKKIGWCHYVLLKEVKLYSND